MTKNSLIVVYDTQKLRWMRAQNLAETLSMPRPQHVDDINNTLSLLAALLPDNAAQVTLGTVHSQINSILAVDARERGGLLYKKIEEARRQAVRQALGSEEYIASGNDGRFGILPVISGINELNEVVRVCPGAFAAAFLEWLTQVVQSCSTKLESDYGIHEHINFHSSVDAIRDGRQTVQGVVDQIHSIAREMRGFSPMAREYSALVPGHYIMSPEEMLLNKYIHLQTMTLLEMCLARNVATEDVLQYATKAENTLSAHGKVLSRAHAELYERTLLDAYRDDNLLIDMSLTGGPVRACEVSDYSQWLTALHKAGTKPTEDQRRTQASVEAILERNGIVRLGYRNIARIAMTKAQRFQQEAEGDSSKFKELMRYRDPTVGVNAKREIAVSASCGLTNSFMNMGVLEQEIREGRLGTIVTESYSSFLMVLVAYGISYDTIKQSITQGFAYLGKPYTLCNPNGKPIDTRKPEGCVRLTDFLVHLLRFHGISDTMTFDDMMQWDPKNSKNRNRPTPIMLLAGQARKHSGGQAAYLGGSDRVIASCVAATNTPDSLQGKPAITQYVNDSDLHVEEGEVFIDHGYVSEGVPAMNRLIAPHLPCLVSNVGYMADGPFGIFQIGRMVTRVVYWSAARRDGVTLASAIAHNQDTGIPNRVDAVGEYFLVSPESIGQCIEQGEKQRRAFDQAFASTSPTT